jgi:hypothetical protein
MKKQIEIIMSLGVFMFALAAYLVSPVTMSTDSVWAVHMATSLVDNGDINLDEYGHLIAVDDYRVTLIDGHLYSTFPIGATLFAAPFIGITKPFLNLEGVSVNEYLLSHRPEERPVSEVEKIPASIIVAICATLIFLIALEYLDPVKALLLTGIFAFATSAWSTASRAMFQHGPSMLCLSAALYLMVIAKRKPFLAAFASIPLALSYIVRPTNSISIAVLTVYVFLNYRKYFAYYLLGLAVCLLPFFSYNYSIYSSILAPYYAADRLGVPSPAFMWAHLFNPSRGLFIFSPVLIFSLIGMYRGLVPFGRGTLYKLEFYLSGIILLHWLAISAFSHWYGGWSVGPRFFTDMLPYFIYFLIPVLDSPPTLNWSPALQKTGTVIFIVLLAFSVFVHFRCATDIEPFMWNSFPTDIAQDTSRLYDWSDIQFLRGMCTNGDYRAPGCWFE